MFTGKHAVFSLSVFAIGAASLLGSLQATSVLSLLGAISKSTLTSGYQCNQNPPTPVFPPGNDQIGNPCYCPKVTNPAFAFGKGPRVLFDEGHYNFSTINPINNGLTTGTYYALGELLKADGFVVDILSGSITSSNLKNYSILILSHALPAPYSTPEAFTGRSAYTHDEIAAATEWVKNGGALFINAEHLPFTGAMMHMSQTFGLTLDEYALGGFPASSTFRKSTPLHPIFQGRNAAESISVVPYVAGGSKIKSTTATSLFAYPPFTLGMHITYEGYETGSGITYFNASGDVVAATVAFGRGRVAQYTEHATFSSQLIDYPVDGIADNQYGGLKNHNPNCTLPQGDNLDVTQLVLNTFHWLARVI